MGPEGITIAWWWWWWGGGLILEMGTFRRNPIGFPSTELQMSFTYELNWKELGNIFDFSRFRERPQLVRLQNLEAECGIFSLHVNETFLDMAYQNSL